MKGRNGNRQNKKMGMKGGKSGKPSKRNRDNEINAVNVRSTLRNQARVLKKFCNRLQQTYMDKLHLDSFLYSFQVSLVDDKRSTRYRPASRLTVEVSVVSTFKGKTRVKNFNSIFYREPSTLLGSRFLHNWLNYFWRDYNDRYHSGEIILDNSHSNLVMLHLSIPRYRLEIKSVSIKSNLDLNTFVYYFMKMLPILILVASVFLAFNVSIFSSVFLLVLIVKCFQGGFSSDAEDKLKDEGELKPTADSAVSARRNQYYDID